MILPVLVPAINESTEIGLLAAAPVEATVVHAFPAAAAPEALSVSQPGPPTQIDRSQAPRSYVRVPDTDAHLPVDFAGRTMAAQPKSGGTYDTLIKLLLIGDSGETTALKRVGGADSPS